MKKIGGLLPLEKTQEKENHFFDSLCTHDDLKFMMSGRCAIYYAIEDIKTTDTKKVAYLPLYTCETVVAPYKKAGYTLMFYHLDRSMTPVFDESVLDKISVINLCGYYGFCKYDREFVKKCKEHGVCIIEDVTHSVLSANGVDPLADYVVGSLRKWMGVAAGGFAMKRNGTFAFAPLEPHPEHLRQRYEAIENNDSELFWSCEMKLRQIFDAYAGDEQSEYIMKHADYQEISKKRRENYQYLLDHMKKNDAIKIVFPQLDAESVPSHFTLFVSDRARFQEYIEKNGIKTSIFWPQGPYIDLTHQDDTRYIYEHVISLPCDQRFDVSDMQYVCDVLNAYGE